MSIRLMIFLITDVWPSMVRLIVDLLTAAVCLMTVRLITANIIALTFGGLVGSGLVSNGE